MGFWANSSVHSVGKVRQSCQNCNLRSLGRLWGKKHVWNFAHCFKFPWNLWQKNKSFIQKIFFRVVTNAIRASTGKFWGKSILLSEKLIFLLEIWICSNFFVPWQISYLGEPKQQCKCLEETFVGTLLWKTVFFQLFGLWAEKLRLFMEKYWHVCRNCSVSARPKKIPENVFG